MISSHASSCSLVFSVPERSCCLHLLMTCSSSILKSTACTSRSSFSSDTCPPPASYRSTSMYVYQTCISNGWGVMCRKQPRNPHHGRSIVPAAAGRETMAGWVPHTPTSRDGGWGGVCNTSSRDSGRARKACATSMVKTISLLVSDSSWCQTAVSQQPEAYPFFHIERLWTSLHQPAGGFCARSARENADYNLGNGGRGALNVWLEC